MLKHNLKQQADINKFHTFQNCKAYAKKSIQYIPTLGWAWKFAESIFLERNWDRDKMIIGTQISELADYPDSMWVIRSFFV